MNRPVITVVGSFAVGLTIRTSHMPIFGETLIGSDFDMGPGGKGSNQAVATARLGANSYFAGIIGDDKLGEIATDLYAREGVDVTYLQKTDKMTTGVGVIIINQIGENGIILDMSANKLMDAAFVNQIEEQIARSELVMSVLEIPVGAAIQAMKIGKNHGVKTILNPAPAQPLPQDAFRYIDYLTPNETELRILLDLPPDDATPTAELAQQLSNLGVGNLIVTMGEEGALFFAGKKMEKVPGLVVDVVDTTGAGDAFNSGLAVAVAAGKPILEAVRYANCAGAIACTQLGVIPSLGTKNQVDQLYREHFG